MIEMTQLGVLLTKYHRLLSIAAILDVFETVNGFFMEEGELPAFKIHLLDAGDAPADSYSGYPIKKLTHETHFDLLLIPAFGIVDTQKAIRENEAFIGWLDEMHHSGAAIASVCTGAFLLAATGLLDDRTATTHVDATGKFAATFPAVHLQADAVVTQDEDIYTSGGSTNSFHLLLLLVENYCGRDMAIRTAKYFAIDMDREQQTQFATFKPVPSRQDELVSQLQERIRKEYAQVNTIEELINDLPSSRRNLARRFKHATGITFIEYLQRTRIEAAKRVLERSSGGVLESMIASGYNDEKTFRQLFKKTVGMTPSSYRDKYSNKIVQQFNKKVHLASRQL
jgi:transcriptional regulator GlxA family with amidase domain